MAWWKELSQTGCQREGGISQAGSQREGEISRAGSQREGEISQVGCQREVSRAGSQREELSRSPVHKKNTINICHCKQNSL